MRKLWTKIIGVGVMVTLLLPEIAMASGPAVAQLVLVADTRKLTGWQSWWANLYNESHFLFALVTIIVIPLVGLMFGIAADLIMSHIGLDLKSRDLAEH
jgi:hypothetical protein